MSMNVPLTMVAVITLARTLMEDITAVAGLGTDFQMMGTAAKVICLQLSYIISEINRITGNSLH